MSQDSEAKKAEIHSLKRDKAEVTARLKSVELDLKLASKDLKLKGERLVELTRQEVEKSRALDLLKKQKEDNDKESDLERERLKIQLQEAQEEATWLKKEMDSVSAILLQRNIEIKELKEKSLASEVKLNAYNNQV